jgi:hypothetical protein
LLLEESKGEDALMKNHSLLRRIGIKIERKILVPKLAHASIPIRKTQQAGGRDRAGTPERQATASLVGVLVLTTTSALCSIGSAHGAVKNNVNIATVATSGAQYTNPVDAANNAYSGDRWCRKKPCRIEVASGLYFLTEHLIIPEGITLSGAGQRATMLIATQGLDTAVTLRGSSIRDVAIINRRNEGSRAIALSIENSSQSPVVVERVGAWAEGATFNIGLAPSAFVQIRSSEIRAIGGTSTRAIDHSAGLLEITSSKVLAADASDENIGLYSIERNLQGKVLLTDTSLLATGGMLAEGLHFESFPLRLEIFGGEISASSSVDARGIRGGSSQGILLRDTRISVNAQGAGGGDHGVVWTLFSGASALFDGIVVESPTLGGVALWFEPTEADTNITVLRSHLAGQAAIEYRGLPISITIERSVLNGPFNTADQVALTIRSSVLVAQAARGSFGASIVECQEVFDEADQLLSATCH